MKQTEITEAIKNRILILDGAMGTMIQRYSLTEKDFHGEIFPETSKQLQGNSECLNLTRPDVIKAIHKEYIKAGADIIESNTFSANRISQEEYGCGSYAYKMAFEGAKIAREAADEAMEWFDKTVYVAGSIGPTSKSLSLASDINDPTFRAYDFDTMTEAYSEQIAGLVDAGVDLLLIETCFDALNVKAVLYAINKNPKAAKLPIMVSASASDRSGRTLTGQTLKAFYTSIRHANIFSFGINCSLGADEMTPLIQDISSWAECAVSCYPNAGLPNEMGEYDQSPEDMAKAVTKMVGHINIAGGCCGTSPAHIKAIAKALEGTSPRPQPLASEKLMVSGLEAYTIDLKANNFTNVGERTNVAGSRKFARLIAEGKYDEALSIAANQIEAGATIIDINMDDAMLDSKREMMRFLRHISNDPAVSKAAIMIDSSHWDTLVEGLKNAQGKCIVNSISLKEGEEDFIRKAKEIHALGAAMVVMAFDEEGQATDYKRKIEISKRAYKLLTKEGIPPSDIIFDVNILSVATGIEEHANYAKDFIEAVRWIKTNLPGALTSGGVSNLSFAFRGNNAVREAMHSAFLYHAIEAGLDMAIVNPSMLQIYDSIDKELLKRIEDVIFNTDPEATERLIEIASILLAAKDQQQTESKEEKKESSGTVEERLCNSLIKGSSQNLQEDIMEALEKYSGKAVQVIEGPLMNGMEKVGELFGAGKMFLPQVVKSAKIMREAVAILEPYLLENSSATSKRPKAVIATVKGDVHDIGKNILGIVLGCNGFDVTDLGVMVDKETIISEAEAQKADIIAVSGLITPSLFQMEELCREMSARGMQTPLLIGGATTSALHTAVKLAPLYGRVFYGADASASAVLAKRWMMNPDEFEKVEHAAQEKLRQLHTEGKKAQAKVESGFAVEVSIAKAMFAKEDYADFELVDGLDLPCGEVALDQVLPYFDWRTFFAIWGIKSRDIAAGGLEIDRIRKDA
jgi:5-methyltetrahydrofolate--homocysteine methyltransferase